MLLMITHCTCSTLLICLDFVIRHLMVFSSLWEVVYSLILYQDLCCMSVVLSIDTWTSARSALGTKRNHSDVSAFCNLFCFYRGIDFIMVIFWPFTNRCFHPHAFRWQISTMIISSQKPYNSINPLFLISLRGEVWAHKTSLVSPLFIGVVVQDTRVSGHVYVSLRYRFYLFFLFFHSNLEFFWRNWIIPF